MKILRNCKIGIFLVELIWANQLCLGHTEDEKVLLLMIMVNILLWKFFCSAYSPNNFQIKEIRKNKVS